MQLLLQLHANIHDLVYLLIHMRKQIYIYRDKSLLPGWLAHTQKVSLSEEQQLINKSWTQLIPFGVHNEACRTEQPLNCGRSS